MIRVYGTKTCADCIRAKMFFEHFSIPYSFIDIEEDEKGKEIVYEKNKDKNHRVPVILFDDESVLIEPSLSQLQERMGI